MSKNSSSSLTNSFDEINQMLITMYPDVKTRKDEDIRGTPGDMKNDLFESVYTSAHKYDCLIHAFLICVSEPFRKLNQDEKNTFADQFRRKVLPKRVEDKHMKALLEKEYVFLSESVLEKLEQLYKINIVNFYELQKSNGSVIYVTYMNKKIQENMPFIFVYNPDNAHFRATRTHIHGHSYLFSYTIGKDLYESYTMDTEFEKAVTICHVKEGDKVKYKDQEYVVEGYYWDDQDPPHCQSIKLKGKDEYVHAHEVTKVTSGGRRRRNRKTRKANRRTKRQTRRH